jgi:hypothetical protein
MATFNNGESGLSVRNKLNTIINKVEGVSTIDNDINVDGVNLSPIASTIADTAVDVFVYDTRKDSDGGAWRKRTQHTSWYNETLNTGTRGSRKEFPAVAVIVAENGTVTIYDGDDPDLPMWMKFTSDSWTGGVPTRASTSGSTTSVYMLNGYFCITSGGTAASGLSTANFVSDVTELITGTGFNYTFNKGTVSLRNVVVTPSAKSGLPPYALVDSPCNDVAMTVLPNAPIDAATGLPVPTIAVATDGGVSVIKDDGTVVDDTTFSPINVISFGIDDDVFYGRNGFGRIYKWDYSADTSSTATYVTNGTNPPIAGNTNGGIVDFGNDEYWASGGNTDGLNVFAENKLAANITSEFNTGWMNGDIKLATLSDTDDTDVTGSELVTNGTFDSDSDWTKDTGWSITGGQASFTSPDGTAAEIQQTITVEANTTYVLSWNVISTSMQTRELYLHVGGNSNIQHYGYDTNTIPTGQSSYTHTTGSSETSLVIGFRANSNVDTGDTLVIDNVTLRLAEEDRSVNGNGLQVFGTVTKDPVATGADLVAYSGFSASNYLEQPYNADMASVKCVYGWFDMTTSSSSQVAAAWANAGETDSYFLVLPVSGSTGKPYIKYFDGTGTWVSIVDLDIRGSRRFIVWVMDQANEELRTYVDGVLLVTTAMSGAATLTATDQVLRVGKGQVAGGPMLGAMSLLRVSASIPTAEQIAKIYEDEKVLFQENAQATLYGDSDAVTALAYDDSTNLLHVGTSEGRSVFQGLRRVDNTTTAVGAAISASGGLVADE